MHVTLHLTTGCNMDCKYCYSPPDDRNDMSQEIANKTVDFVAKNYDKNSGIIFFGGEPLLKKDLIKETIEYGKTKSDSYHYKITTNGLLLDEDFLEYAKEESLQIALSLDGTKAAHDTARIAKDGSSTFDKVIDKVPMLLEYQPYAKCLMTVSPETVQYYAESVEFLLETGFKYLIVSLNYAGDWKEEHLVELKKQYEKISKIYEENILKEKKFYFSPFEMKFASHIRQSNYENYQCQFGQKQISIGFDGKIYPCVQFVQDGLSNCEYSMGSILTELDKEKQACLYTESKKQHEVCLECDYNPRCNNKCSCLNWQITGELTEISPLVCETERILIPIIDDLGERLYKKNAPMFIQKHYNAVYPILSMMEDMESGTMKQ